MRRRAFCVTAILIILLIGSLVAGIKGNAAIKRQSSTPVHKQVMVHKKKITSHEIAWLDLKDINVPFAKYVRMVKITIGKHAGELLVTYEDRKHGGNFWEIRSMDGGLTWMKPKILLKWDRANGTMISNCNIIQLDDGRLMMVHQERPISHYTAQNTGIKVRYSSDGGETWTADTINGVQVATRDTGQLALRANGWEPRAIQVPHDENGDGNNDIYIFWTNNFYLPSQTDLTEKNKVGRGISYVVSYDDGKTWVNPSKEKYSGGIVFRNFTVKDPNDIGGGGGMPTPFILPNNRLAFVAECPECKQSPWLVASDPNDWDFKHFLSKPWSSMTFTESNGNNVFPSDPKNAWQPTTAWGNAPYASVLPNGEVAISENSQHRIRLWVGDANAKNTVEQERPFGDMPSFYPFIEPINQAFVLAGAHNPQTNHVLLRRGFIVDPANLDELMKLGLKKKAITNQGVYQSLLAKVKDIQKMNQKNNVQGMLDGLNALSKDVDALSGGKINVKFSKQILQIIGYIKDQYE